MSKLICADAAAGRKTLPSESVQMCVTFPSIMVCAATERTDRSLQLDQNRRREMRRESSGNRRRMRQRRGRNDRRRWDDLTQKNRQDKESATGTFETPQSALQSGKPAFVFLEGGYG